MFAIACSNGKQDNDTGAPPDLASVCEEQSQASNLDLPPFALRFIVLSQDANAPQPDTGAVPCEGGDTGWPCNHLTALDTKFSEAAGDTGDRGARICLDSADELLPDTAASLSCVRFEYFNHLYRSDLDTGDMSAACQELVAEADHAVVPGDTADTELALRATLTAAILACDDEDLFGPTSQSVSVLIWDNPFAGNSSFHTWRDPDQQCNSVLMIDKDRLPRFNRGEFEFAVNEHEMSRAFGLRHVCYAGSTHPHQDVGRTNTMATGSQAECCCECAASQGISPSSEAPWLDVCVGCAGVNTGDTGLADSGDPPDTGDQCVDTGIGGWDQCSDPSVADSCANSPGLVDAGDRSLGFSDDFISYDTDQGQLQRIRAGARNHWRCDCLAGSEPNVSRIKVQREINCHGGSGRFALLFDRFVDSDNDDEAYATFVPVLISGDHLGRLSWVRSAQVVDFGDYDHLFAGQAGHAFAYDAQHPDEFIETHLERFDGSTTSRTWPNGIVSTAVHWASDEVDASLSALEYPVVDLTWSCANDYAADDVFAVPRPSDAYPLHLSDLHDDLDWDQQLIVRPDFDRERLWLELRGMPGQATSLSIDPISGTSRWAWSFDYRGVVMSGWIEPVGTPTGSKLRVFIDEGSFRSETWDDLTLPDLVKLP